MQMGGGGGTNLEPVTLGSSLAHMRSVAAAAQCVLALRSEATLLQRICEVGHSERANMPESSARVRAPRSTQHRRVAEWQFVKRVSAWHHALGKVYLEQGGKENAEAMAIAVGDGV